MADRMKLPPESVLGTADVAALLGVTRQCVSQLKKDPTFPRAGMHYGRIGFWHRAGIECWAAAHRPHRREAAGRFAGGSGALLLAAEAAASAVDIHWIDTSMLWFAVARGGAGEGLAGSLRSMGVTPETFEAYFTAIQSGDARPRTSFRMTPHLQTFLAAADRRVADDGRAIVRPIDILLALIDAPHERHADDRRPRSPDNMIVIFEARGVDVAELRRRLVAADADPTTVAHFDERALRRPRGRRLKRPFELAPNPLGHDPYTRFPWGAAFARTRDGRHLKVDGEVWFFKTDGDGFYIRAPDGRPVGYRYRTEPPPRIRRGQRWVKPVNGFMEVLPMPPVEMADWPDRRFEPDD
jgi:hypothetical protein